MFFISHRGNISGKDPERENSPLFIIESIEAGYDVEVDIWYEKGEFYLGHDYPQYETDVEFLKNEKIWCHCKNIEALGKARDANLHCFFHQTDDVTLTSKGLLWVYPGKKLINNSFCVLPEVSDYSIEDLSKCAGICSDNIEKYYKIFTS